MNKFRDNQNLRNSQSNKKKYNKSKVNNNTFNSLLRTKKEEIENNKGKNKSFMKCRKSMKGIEFYLSNQNTIRKSKYKRNT